MIPRETLCRLEDALVSIVIIVLHMFIDHLDVDVRCPRICIDDCQKNFVFVYVVLNEVLLHVLGTPGYI